MVNGIVSAHLEGYGFVIVKDRQKDVYLSVHEMRSLMDGDHVSIKLLGNNTERQSGQLVEILKRGTKKIVGQLAFKYGGYYVDAHKKNNATKINIRKENLSGANVGEYVEVDITQYPSKKSSMYGVIRENLGSKEEKGIHTDIAIKNYELPCTWPKEVNIEIKKFASNEVLDIKEVERRKDLRGYNLITIDGDDARDFDDAVYCENNNKWMAIIGSHCRC